VNEVLIGKSSTNEKFSIAAVCLISRCHLGLSFSITAVFFLVGAQIQEVGYSTLEYDS
jgi:hypothetical protein